MNLSHRSESSPWIVEFNESERRAPAVFQVDESNFTELVEEILDVLRTDVRRQITHVYSAFVSAAVRHDTYCFPTRRAVYSQNVRGLVEIKKKLTTTTPVDERQRDWRAIRSNRRSLGHRDQPRVTEGDRKRPKSTEVSRLNGGPVFMKVPFLALFIARF